MDAQTISSAQLLFLILGFSAVYFHFSSLFGTMFLKE